MILQIADWKIEIACSDRVADVLQNLKPFLVADVPEASPEMGCRLELECTVPDAAGLPDAVNKLEGRTIQIWLTDDYCHIRWIPSDGSFVCQLRANRRWSRVQTDLKLVSFCHYAVLNDFIMLSFIYSIAFAGGVLVHASCVAIGDRGVAFVGPSGIGKSTHSRLWLRHIPGTRLLNDDQPVLRLMPDGAVKLYGSPWSGKTSCYVNEGVRLEALFRMEQSAENRIDRMSGVDTFRTLLGFTSLIVRDGITFAAISGTLARLAGIVPMFVLYNKPDKEAAELSRSASFCSTTFKSR